MKIINGQKKNVFWKKTKGIEEKTSLKENQNKRETVAQNGKKMFTVPY